MNTATPLRAFLDQMKQKSSSEKAMSNNKKSQRNLFVDPMVSRYMGNTGMGEDGMLQTNKPTAMMQGRNGPAMVHEGEDMYQKKNGDMMVVPARMSQGRMQMMEKNMNIPGYATGGIIPASPIPKAAQDAANAFNPPTINKEAVTIKAPTAPTVTASNFATEAPITHEAVTPKAATPPEVAKTPIVAPVTSPAVTPAATPATGTSYMQSALGRLSDIMNGSPALKAAQDKQLKDLKTTQGLQSRVAGFEGAQAGLTPEAALTNKAMGRAVAGSQLANAQAQMGINEMTQQEQAAKDLATTAPTLQNMEIKQTDQVSNLANQGFSKEQINSTLGTNLSDSQYASILGSTSRGIGQINAAVSAGDYNGANSLLAASGLPPIDFTKLQAGESRQVLSDIDGMIDSLGPNADPAVITALSTMRGKVQSSVWKSFGFDPTTSTLTNADGTKTSLSDILSNIDNPSTPKTVETVAKITGNTEAFLDLPEGGRIMQQLSLKQNWMDLYDKALNGDSKSAIEMGQVLGAAETMQANIDEPNSVPPSPEQRALLERYGIWREAPADQATVNIKVTSISDMISNKNISGAQKAYDNLTDAEKKVAGSFEDISGGALDQAARSIIAKQSFGTDLTGLKETDPLMKAVLAASPVASFSYNNRAGKNDIITGAPRAGSWVKIKTPDGEKMLEVTFNGHLDTAGTSDRAYLELRDASGKMYSTSGSNTDIVSGTNTKYKKKK